MTGKTIEIIDSFDPDKKYKIHIGKQIISVSSKLEKHEVELLIDMLKDLHDELQQNKSIKD